MVAYMQSRTALLDSHIVSLTQYLAILIYKARPDRYATFIEARLGLLISRLEARVV